MNGPTPIVRNKLLRILVAALLYICIPAIVSADEPLHVRIDRAIAAATPDYAKKAAPLSSDAEFLRRVTLDLTGLIPAPDDVRRFLKDTSPTKRQTEIDRLLASPNYAWHMADVFDVTLMERRLDFISLAAPWKEYLRASFAANKPWDQLTREILANDGTDTATRPAVRFYLDREMQFDTLTRDIGRMFLGSNLQCAQCHDHPIYSDYTQDDYFGIYAFLNRTVTFADPVKKYNVLGEKADGEITFVDVFDKKKKSNTAVPHVPTAEVLKDPPLEKGKEYVTAPTATTRPVPKYSRRSQLVPAVTNSTAYRRNIANRLWAHMLGRGLIHPLDESHDGNPPSHPELLTLLADDFAAHKYDIRYFFRELALSRTYQLSSELPAGVKIQPQQYLTANLKALSPEQLAWSLMQATNQIELTRKTQGKTATDESVRKALVGHLISFHQNFNNGTGVPASFFARTDHALFLTNGSPLSLWILSTVGNLTFRLFSMKTPQEVADELYLSVLTRLPDDEERKAVIDYLTPGFKNDPERQAGVMELITSLCASTEFRFNH